MKLDAKFEGQIRKVKDGSLVPDDQWWLFLIKDEAFWAMVCDPSFGYLARCHDLECDGAQILAVQRALERATTWRSQNPHLLKAPDAKGERLLDLPNDNAPPQPAPSPAGAIDGNWWMNWRELQQLYQRAMAIALDRPEKDAGIVGEPEMAALAHASRVRSLEAELARRRSAPLVTEEAVERGANELERQLVPYRCDPRLRQPVEHV